MFPWLVLRFIGSRNQRKRPICHGYLRVSLERVLFEIPFGECLVKSTSLQIALIAQSCLPESFRGGCSVGVEA
jgi:hypothetical protein